ncbi:MAG: MotA/TolQ/ExbB proton channel family protein [Bacteroidetes bacterium]|nr:MotA/TolQ/ExbB proton channel family protein [Bacteroidota bacterium]
MKKAFFLIMVGALFFAQPFTTLAQDNKAATEQTDSTAQVANPDNSATQTTAAPETEVAKDTEQPQEEKGGNQFIKEKFIEGDPFYMSLVLFCLIFGMAVAIERIIFLFLSSINTKKFVEEIEDALVNHGVEAAKEKCRNTRGPVASIFYQGVDRIDEGIENVEKAVVSYGSVKVGELERGLTWLALFIALAPMLGFLGTVVGMIIAFDDIEREGDMSPALVARGIKVALLTTVAGLIVAIILQIFYNIIMSKVESISNEMEDASISLVDILVKNKLTK